MPDEMKRVQVNMSRKLRDMLRDWAAEISKERDEEIGTGTVAGLLLEELIKRPELVHQVLFKTEDSEPASNGRASPKKGKGRTDIAA